MHKNRQWKTRVSRSGPGLQKKDLNEEKMKPLNLCGWVFKLFAIARLESYTNRASSSGPPVLKKRSDGRKFPKRTQNQSKDQFRRSNLMARSRKKRLIMNWTIGSVFWEVSGLAPCSSEIFLSGQWFRTTLLSFNLGLDLPFRFIPFQFFVVRRDVFNVFWHIRCGVEWHLQIYRWIPENTK